MDFLEPTSTRIVDKLLFITLGILVFLIIMQFLSCQTDPTATDVAWEKFENKKYSEAYTDFIAIQDDPKGLVGLGWTLLRLDSLTRAEDVFTRAAGDSIVDGYAGWSAVAWRNSHFTVAIRASDFVQRMEPGYLFAHDQSVDISDIKLHKAYSLYHLQNYQSCNGVMQELDPSWVASNDATTLLAKLESLYNTYQ